MAFRFRKAKPGQEPGIDPSRIKHYINPVDNSKQLDQSRILSDYSKLAANGLAMKVLYTMPTDETLGPNVKPYKTKPTDEQLHFIQLLKEPTPDGVKAGYKKAFGLDHGEVVDVYNELLQKNPKLRTEDLYIMALRETGFRVQQREGKNVQDINDYRVSRNVDRPPVQRVNIKSGDDLRDIAETYSGHRAMWIVIAHYNRMSTDNPIVDADIELLIPPENFIPKKDWNPFGK